MKILKQLGSVIVMVGIVLIFANTPAYLWNWDTWFGGNNFGAVALTDITGSTKVSAYPTIQNANNTILEDAINGLQASTTLSLVTSIPNLATIGTITTGIWNGTTIAVGKGGTGSTTPSGLLWGDGAGNYTSIPAGTLGQYLQSKGAGVIPGYETSSIDDTADYTWTGHHIFSSLFATAASSTNATTTNLTVTGNAIFSGTLSGVAAVATSTTFLSSGTWTKPSNAKIVLIQLWGGGASGASGDNSGGGGGGMYIDAWVDASVLGSTETVTIGTGGSGVTNADGNDGVDSTFGSFLTADGGRKVPGRQGSGVAATGGDGGNIYGTVTGFYGAGVSGSNGGSGNFSAAGGGVSAGNVGQTGGNTVYGGAGGGGASDAGNSGGSGGTSKFGGNGGASSGTGAGTAGSQPGGGGGASAAAASSGAGGAGKAIITTFF